MNNGHDTYNKPDFDDGLLMSALDLVGEPPGTLRSQRDLAHYCNCERQAIQQREHKIFAKIKVRLAAYPELMENWREIFAGQTRPLGKPKFKVVGHDDDGTVTGDCNFTCTKQPSRDWSQMGVGAQREVRQACDTWWRERGLGEFC
jgi:hypothetical protein